MILDDVFQFLHDTGLARNHAIFSTDYLGHSPRYYDYLRCSNASPSLRSQLKLAMCLTDIANEPATAPNAAARASILAMRVMTAALRGCRQISSVPKKVLY